MKKLILLAMVSVMIALTAGIGADFKYYEAERNYSIHVVADDQEFIDLTPNQPYAYIAQNGMLVVDFSEDNLNYQNESMNPGWWGKGVSPDSLYVFDCVFKVSNDLWDEVPIAVDIQASQDVSIIRLYSPDHDTNNSWETATSNLNGLVIMPGNDTCIGMVIDTNGYEGDSPEITMQIFAEPTSVE